MSQTWNVDLIGAATTSPATDIQRILDAFNALRSLFSGASEPAVADQVAYMLWADTTSGLLKIRNAANNAWITMGSLSLANLGHLLASGSNLTGGLNDAKSTVASATTPDLFAITVADLVDYTGTTTATGFATAPQAGAKRTLLCASTPSFTAGTNLLIDGLNSGDTYVAVAGEVLEVRALTTTQFRLRSRLRVGGDFRVRGRGLTVTQSVSYAATVVVDASLSNYFEIGTLTGNVTTLTINNTTGGHSLTIRFKQDGTGGRTVAAPSGAKISGAIDTTAGVVSHLSMTFSLADSRWEGYWSSVPL